MFSCPAYQGRSHVLLPFTAIPAILNYIRHVCLYISSICALPIPVCVSAGHTSALSLQLQAYIGTHTHAILYICTYVYVCIFLCALYCWWISPEAKCNSRFATYTMDSWPIDGCWLQLVNAILGIALEGHQKPSHTKTKKKQAHLYMYIYNSYTRRENKNRMKNADDDDSGKQQHDTQCNCNKHLWVELLLIRVYSIVYLYRHMHTYIHRIYKCDTIKAVYSFCLSLCSPLALLTFRHTPTHTHAHLQFHIITHDRCCKHSYILIAESGSFMRTIQRMVYWNLC